MVFNNIQDSGVQDSSTAYLRAHLETMLGDYALVNDGTPVNLCGQQQEDQGNGDDGIYANDDAVYSNTNDDGYNVEEAYYQVDDAYLTQNQVNDAEKCPQDGVYAFDTEFNIPKLGRMWRATGFQANANVKLAAGGNVIGSCSLVFQTRAFGLSSKKFFTILGSILSVTLFVGIFFALRRVNGRYKASDDARAFHEMGKDFCQAAAETATKSCTHPSNDKEKKKDLEITFESDSTPSFSEHQDSIDTSFGTPPNRRARSTPGVRPSPLRVREFMNARFHPPLTVTLERGVDSAFAFQADPPSPIKKADDDVESTMAQYYSPPRHLV